MELEIRKNGLLLLKLNGQIRRFPTREACCARRYGTLEAALKLAAPDYDRAPSPSIPMLVEWLVVPGPHLTQDTHRDLYRLPLAPRQPRLASAPQDCEFCFQNSLAKFATVALKNRTGVGG
jgi:hypothetical protein